MSPTTPMTRVPSRARTDKVKWQSKIYQAVATPINFVAFLVSLYLIDSRHRAQRYGQHESRASGNNERPWLHRLLYQQRSPYDWMDSYQGRASPQSAYTTPHHDVKAKDGASRSIKETRASWFYHTKQKKLLRVEAADAFALRNSVLFALFVLVVFVLWVLWRAVVWLIAWA
ncbi:hypothetical protein F5X98DRAFT_338747 [Xylaria grammica]|nr:hypothetical protein F5X98DRAFT_338747 [Xylaria grammica]